MLFIYIFNERDEEPRFWPAEESLLCVWHSYIVEWWLPEVHCKHVYYTVIAIYDQCLRCTTAFWFCVSSRALKWPKKTLTDEQILHIRTANTSAVQWLYEAEVASTPKEEEEE